MKSIIIGGSGRSGTTLLANLIGSHLDVWRGLEESHLFTGPYGLVRLCGLVSDDYSYLVGGDQLKRYQDYIIQRLDAWLTGMVKRNINGGIDQTVRKWFNGLKADVYKTNAQLVGGIQSAAVLLKPFSRRAAFAYARSLILQVLEGPLARAGKHCWSEKTPWSVLLFPQISQILPGAKFLHITRNAKDVIDSIHSMAWGPPTLVQAMEMYSAWLTRWEQVRPHVHSEYMQVRYEDLTANTKIVWRQILEFCDLRPTATPKIAAKNAGRGNNWPAADQAHFKCTIERRAERSGFLR